MSSCFLCITACLIQVCLNTSVLGPRPAFRHLLGGAWEQDYCLTTSVLYLAADVYTFCMAIILSNNRITGRFVHAPWSDCSRVVTQPRSQGVPSHRPKIKRAWEVTKVGWWLDAPLTVQSFSHWGCNITPLFSLSAGIAGTLRGLLEDEDAVVRQRSAHALGFMAGEDCNGQKTKIKLPNQVLLFFHPSCVSWQTTCKYNLGPPPCVSGNISGSAGLILLFPEAKKNRLKQLALSQLSTITFVFVSFVATNNFS